MPPQRRAVIDDTVRVGVTEQPDVAAAEGLHAVSVRFRNFARGVDFIVHDDDHALAAGFGGDGNAHRIQEIERPVGRQSGIRPLRAGDDDGLVAAHRQIEKIRGLFEAVGALHEDDAVNFITLEHFFDFDGEPAQLVVRGDFLRIAGIDIDVGQRTEFGQRRQQFFARHAWFAAAAVACEIHAVAAAAMQRAGCDHQAQAWLRHTVSSVQIAAACMALPSS